MVDDCALELVREEIADNAQRQLRFLIHERRRRCLLRLVLDRLPEALEEVDVALDVLRGDALRRGADDQAALLRGDLLEDVAEARALLVRQAPGDTGALSARDVDDEAAGQRDVSREPRALRLHRVLDGLDEELLAAAEQVLDLPAMPAALELRRDDLVDVEEAVLLEADLDERGLHPGEDVVDGALVDVARDRAALGALEVDLGGSVVLEHGDALLADVDRDEQLALRLRERRPPRWGAATLLLARAWLRGRIPLRLVGLLLGGSLVFRRGAARRTGRLAPVAAAAGSASPPWLGRCGLCARLSGRLGYCR